VASPYINDAQFAAVSGSAPNDVWAVGSLLGFEPLIEHWDGTSWTQTPQPKSSGVLRGVAATSATEAWAVGDIDNGKVLVERWDGTAWHLFPAPSPGNPDNGLAAISVLSPADIWAGGHHSAANGSIQPLYEHWDGTNWNVVPEAPGTPNNGGEIYGISAVATDDVWAVGYQGGQQFGQFDPLTEHWDGTSWQVVPAVLPPPGANEFFGVYAAASTDVWAVGGAISANVAFMEHWDGTKWILAQTISGASLHGVSGTSPTDVWAVGNLETASMTEHWDGAAWTRQPTPNPNGNSFLVATLSLSPTESWAVGGYHPAGTISPAAMRSRGPCA
jgi:hypothetical protein